MLNRKDIHMDAERTLKISRLPTGTPAPATVLESVSSRHGEEDVAKKALSWARIAEATYSSLIAANI